VKRSLFYQIGGEAGVDFERLSGEVLLAEALGFESVWLFPALSQERGFGGQAPEIWLGGLAARTERIRLGWGVAGQTPPLRPPIRVAEQGASLDLASAGRLEVALLPEGAPAWEETDWQEGYRMWVDMWDGPTFSWTSPRFEVRPIDVLPKPVQKPHPPLWLAGWDLDHARAAGAGGLGFLDLSGGALDRLEVHRDAYAEARSACDPNELVSGSAFAVAGEFEPDPDGQAQLAALEDLGVDQVVVRASMSEWGPEKSLERIRSFGEVESGAPS
jgi:alkanesulfonate monooxygenase SsuD/methylene tetrahydromethanopterin reductase-like flavin-dependent oxidoreductase (luciferase family)